MKRAADERTTAERDILGALLARRSDFRTFLRRRVGDEAVADDLLQQSFLRAVQHAHGVKDAEHSVAWFYRILRHALIDYYRAQAADHRKSDGLLRELLTAGEDTAPAMDEWRPTVCACLERLLPTLRPAYADVIRRVDLNGEAPDTVATSLGVTVNNLTVRLHRARQALRKSLEQVCGICTRHGCLDCTCE